MVQSAVPVQTTGLHRPVGPQIFVDAFDAAMTAYWRANHDERVNMLLHLLAFGSDEEVEDECEEPSGEYGGRCAAIYRAAWQEDPYVDNIRHGTMFSLIEGLFPGAYTPEATNRAFAKFGRLMMYEREHSLLNAMEFPRTVYRGGAGCENDVRKGRSWTFDVEKAIFFAEKWPKRWGNPGEPVLLQMQIDRADVMAYLCDREEEEVILVAGQGTDLTRCVRLYELD